MESAFYIISKESHLDQINTRLLDQLRNVSNVREKLLTLKEYLLGLTEVPNPQNMEDPKFEVLYPIKHALKEKFDLLEVSFNKKVFVTIVIVGVKAEEVVMKELNELINLALSKLE
jgi:hypothetical protein